MHHKREKFCCYPTVVEAGKVSRITIFPEDNSRIFRAEDEYGVGVVGLLEDMTTHYYHPQPMDVPCQVENGVLCFTYEFRQEQEYQIYFAKKGEQPTILSLYALDADLYSRRPLKGDLHTHSYYSDGSDGVGITPANYREEGYDFFCLTDHNRMYPSTIQPQLYEGVALGMHMMAGEEIHTPGSMLHIVNAGSKHSVCDLYVRDPEGYEKAVDEIAETLAHIPEAYRRRTAMAHWACRQIHKAGGLAILAHPYWRPRKYNVSPEFCQILFQEQIFDAFELIGGIAYEQCNLQLALWQEQVASGNNIPVVGSSDAHNHDFDKDVFGHRFTLVFAKENTTEAILQAIKDGFSIAGETSMVSNEVRLYGNRRLVLFGHFLWKNYFSRTAALCACEGILMRRYALGEEVGQTLSSLADSVHAFYRRFYGLDPAPVIAPRVQAFLNDLRTAQRESGIPTKGSLLDYAPGRDRRE